MGLRSATEISASLSQMFASRFNDDKKTLAFSDSVQDAAHKAGFFNSRTWRFGLRTAIQTYCTEFGAGKSLLEFQEGFIEYWHKHMTDEEFVSFFIPPNLTWKHAYEDLIENRKFGKDKQAQILMYEIEQRLKQSLCAERVVWINHGNLIGDDTDGHIDTLVRICPDDTLLYIAADDEHPDLLRMEEELYGLRTLSGRPYRLLKLPMPRPIYDEGDRLPATYANFLVINGAVLCPTYGQPDLDAEALRLIGEAFPGRDIIGIDCRSIIRQHGSLHCCTMQYPKNVIV